MKGKLLIFLLLCSSFLLKAQLDSIQTVFVKSNQKSNQKSNIEYIKYEDGTKDIVQMPVEVDLFMPPPILRVKGFVDAYYSYDLSQPRSLSDF